MGKITYRLGIGWTWIASRNMRECLVFSRFGISKVIPPNNGPEFVQSKSSLNKVGCKKFKNPMYSSKFNSEAEITVWITESSLKGYRFSRLENLMGVY